jgi:hypothetical protein
VIMEWRVIPGWPDYEISECGDARRITASKTTKAGRLLRGFVKENGYKIHLLRKDGVTRKVLAHRLVLEAFVGPAPPDKPEGCHNDGTRSNNHWTNLRWGSRSDNQMDRVLHGTSKRGRQHHNVKLAETMVRDIRNRAALGESKIKIAKEYGVHVQSVYAISYGRRWAWLT